MLAMLWRKSASSPANARGWWAPAMSTPWTSPRWRMATPAAAWILGSPPRSHLDVTLGPLHLGEHEGAGGVEQAADEVVATRGHAAHDRPAAVEPRAGAQAEATFRVPLLEHRHVEVEHPAHGLDDLGEEVVDGRRHERELADAGELGLHPGPADELGLHRGAGEAGVDLGLAVGDRLEGEGDLVAEALEQVEAELVVRVGLGHRGAEHGDDVVAAAQRHGARRPDPGPG